MDATKQFLEGALIIDGLIPEDHLWDELKELLNEIGDLPQPIPWPGLDTSVGKLRMSVHRKTKSGDVCPAIEWVASALARSTACAAIAVQYGPLSADRGTDLSVATSGAVHDFVRTLVFAANIARPGCLRVQSINWRSIDGSCERRPGLVHDLGRAVEYSRRTGWPALDPISFRSVYMWIGLNLFHLRAGDTPVSRAFNAYTWLFGEPGDAHPFRLVSALIGIEALFATTTSGVAEQVRRRAQLLLGSRTSFKKDLDNMYTARSAFLHGSAHLLPNGLSWDPSDAVGSKLDKGSNAEDVASAVLLSSLQRLVAKGWSRLEFSEALMGADDVPQSEEEAILGFTYPYAEKSALEAWAAQFIRRFD